MPAPAAARGKAKPLSKASAKSAPGPSAKPNRPHLLVHDHKDNVGVVVIEDLAAGTEMLAVVTHDNFDFRITAKHDIPIGHKVALTDLKKGDTIWKYGADIGRATADVGKGEHLHVHNARTKRW
jgi:(2R)-sulfolactate sulfo-lyase subunit alpha